MMLVLFIVVFCGVIDHNKVFFVSARFLLYAHERSVKLEKIGITGTDNFNWDVFCRTLDFLFGRIYALLLSGAIDTLPGSGS
ncbi:unnamed protein product [Onchocerca ochengi]|uniref:Secreted protein n=1 Tax=Onchocerca ochengi TaxID=42157 RepID=A0A182E668_ONCOC|nr:unnamed protein product [Onchocerca ochengi]